MFIAIEAIHTRMSLTSYPPSLRTDDKKLTSCMQSAEGREDTGAGLTTETEKRTGIIAFLENAITHHTTPGGTGGR